MGFDKYNICRYFTYIVVFLIFLYEVANTYSYGYYNVACYEELADAFMAGHTYLLRDPPAGLLALSDPWDPKANALYRNPPVTDATQPYKGVHDLTLYNGKLYLQWGPFPALVLIPLHWVLGHRLPMGQIGVFVQISAAFAFMAATLKLAQLAGFQKSCFMSIVALLLFLLCPVWTFTARRIAAYEFAVFFGQLCIGLSLLSLTGALAARHAAGQKKYWLLGLSSLLLGCAVNCRIDITPIGLMVPIVTYAWWRLGPTPRPWPQMIGPALCLGLPAASLLICTLLYNKIRFDDFLEVGQNWQLWGDQENIRISKFRFLETARFLPNIWYEFFCPFAISPEFPFIAKPIIVWPRSWLDPETFAAYSNSIGWTSGLFVTMPMTVLALLFPLMRSQVASIRPVLGMRSVATLLMATCLAAGVLPFLAAAISRYEAQWCMWWIAASLLVTFWIRARLRARKWRFAAASFDAALFLSVAWTSWIGLSFVLFPALDP